MSPDLHFEELNGQTVQGLVVADGLETYRVLTEGNFSPVDAASLAHMRCRLGPYHQVSWTGSRLTDCLLWWEGHFLLWRAGSRSPLFDPVAQLHHLDLEEIPLSFAPDGEDFLLLGQDESFDVPMDEVGQEPITRFLLGAEAVPYRAFLEACGITHLPFVLPPVSLLRHHPYAFLRPLVMRCTDNWSGFVAVNDLHLPYGTRLVPPSTPVPSGLLRPEESFPWARLAHFASLLALPERTSYTLSGLETHCRSQHMEAMLGPILRRLRGGSDLPVSHQTFLTNDASIIGFKLD